MDIFEFIRNYDVDYAASLISESDLQLAERKLGIKFGSQLSAYLLD